MISLICTVRNESATIEALIASVEAQTLRPGEMIVVDAGSSDGTAGRLRAMSASRLWLRIIESEGASIAKGRNIAIEAAQHEIVAMTDAGVRLHPDWLRRLTQPFLDDPAVAVTGGWTVMAPETPVERWIADLHKTPADIDPKNFLPSARSLAVRKDIWREAGGFPEWLTFAGEDTLFLENVKRAGHQVRFVPDAYAYWRPRSSFG